MESPDVILIKDEDDIGGCGSVVGELAFPVVFASKIARNDQRGEVGGGNPVNLKSVFNEFNDKMLE